MKLFLSQRGKSKHPFTCTNGDVYDSTLTVLANDGLPLTTEVLYHSNLVNTDPTLHYQGGRLPRGLECFGIRGYRVNEDGTRGKCVIKLFNTQTDLAKLAPKPGDEGKDMSLMLSAADKILPSEIPNPNHQGERWMSEVQLHDGGVTWDFSHGCPTALNREGHLEYDRLLGVIAFNEIIRFRLI